MISARGRARTRRYLLIGLMLSLMVHLTGGSIYGILARAAVKALPQLASLQAVPAPHADVIRLEKALPQQQQQAARAKPHPKPPPPPPAPLTAAQPIVAPAEVHHELAHLTTHAPRQPAPSHGQSLAELPRQIQPPAAPPQQPRSQYYSDQQLAQLSGQFQQSIAQSHQTLAQANAAMDTAPVITTKHFQMQFNGIHEGMNPGDGIITPIHWERRGNTMWYWTHYEYMYADGHVEEDDIPWPFHYPIHDDPFARGDRRIPLQAPPADYKPDRPLKPILMQFFGGPQVD